MLPSSGWLPAANNQQSNTVRALLPEAYIVTYKAGTVQTIISKPGVTGVFLIDGDVDIATFHGLDLSGTYGILAQLTVHNAYFAALLDTLTIAELLSTSLLDKESCPDTAVVDTTRDDVSVTDIIEPCPDVTDAITEPILPQPPLTSFEACCGVLNIPLCNGQYLADGSILAA